MIDDLVAGWKKIEEAEGAYIEAQEQFDGTAAEVFASEAVARAISETGEAYKMPLIRAAVKVLAARCQIRKVTSPSQAAVTQWIQDVHAANDLDVYYRELITETFKLGDYYLMIYPLWSEGETPEPAASESDEELEDVGIEFTTHSPRRVRVFYDEENERRKVFALKRWPKKLPGKEDDHWRVDLYYPDHIEHWISRHGLPQDAPEGWEESAPDDVNPHGEIPFFHFRTELLYGESVMAPGYGAQNAITKMTVTQLTTSESQAFAQRYALTDPDADLDESLDGADFPEDDDANADAYDGPLRTRGGSSSNLRGGSGTLLTLRGIKEVGQFKEADPGVFTDPANEYVDMLAMLTETPIHSYKPRVQPESGEAKRIAEAPLVKRATEMQTMLRTPLVEAWRFALKLGRKNPKVPLHVSWSPAYAADGVDDWQRIVLQIQSGVPQDVVLTEAGYEQDQVKTWLDDQPEQKSLDGKLKAMQTLGGYLQAAGLAQVLGVTMGASGTQGSLSGPFYEAAVQLVAQITTTTDRPG